MARLRRLVVSNQPHHLVQRGADRQPIYRGTDDYLIFLQHLGDAAKQFSVAIHAYVLMPNHFHLLASPTETNGLARMIQWIGRKYVPYFNRKHGRTGTLWQGRYRTSVVDSERYFLVCSRYIELNPVRAGLSGDPVEYPWSSYAHHAGIKPDPLITDHPLYWALGNTPFDRELAYRHLMEQALTPLELECLRDATNKGWAFGTDEFKKTLERQTERRVKPAKRGRPRKSPATDT